MLSDILQSLKKKTNNDSRGFNEEPKLLVHSQYVMNYEEQPNETNDKLITNSTVGDRKE